MSVNARTLRGAEHHVCLDFMPGGEVLFYPTTTDPAELARRLARMVRMLVEHPSAVACAAGYHEARER